MQKKKLRLLRSNLQYAFIADGAAGLDLAGNLTLGGKILTYNPSLHQDIALKWDPTGNQRSYAFTYNGNLGQLQFDVSDDGVNANNSATQCGVSWTATEGVEADVQVKYNMAAGTAAFFVDGVQVGTTQTGLVTSIFQSSAAFTIGTYGHSTGGAQSECMNGHVRDVRVFADLRSDAEMLADATRVWSNPGNTTLTDPNLVALWPMNGNLEDLSENENHLTGVNNPIYVPYRPPGQFSKSWIINDTKLSFYYKLESDGSDESANNNDLTVHGTPTFAAALFGNGVTIDSIAKYLDKTSGGAGLATGTNDFTFGLRVKRLGTIANTPSAYPFIAIETDGNNTAGLIPGSTDNYIRGMTFGSGTASYSTQYLLPLSRFVTVLFTRYDSGTKFKIVVNGRVISIDTVTDRDIGSSAKIRIGNGYNLNSQIDDVFGLARSMRSDEAIAISKPRRVLLG